MSAAQAPALDMDKLNAFIGQFVSDLGASVHAAMVVIGERLGLQKALAADPARACSALPTRARRKLASAWARKPVRHESATS